MLCNHNCSLDTNSSISIHSSLLTIIYNVIHSIYTVIRSSYVTVIGRPPFQPPASSVLSLVVPGLVFWKPHTNRLVQSNMLTLASLLFNPFYQEFFLMMSSKPWMAYPFSHWATYVLFPNWLDYYFIWKLLQTFMYRVLYSVGVIYRAINSLE